MNPGNRKIYPPEIKAAHDAKEKYVVDFLITATDELSRGFAKNNEGHEFLPDRAKLVLCFTIMDVLAGFWEKYNDRTYASSSQKAQFFDWANKFCLTAHNKAYAKTMMLQALTIENLYDLRCSIVHAYCLPEKREDTHMGILPNESSDEYIESFAKKLSEKGGGKDIMLKPDYIHSMVMDGAELMLKEMVHQIESNPDFHIEGVERIYQELQRRGAASIKLNKDMIKKPLK